jgi:hypothetical protein
LKPDALNKVNFNKEDFIPSNIHQKNVTIEKNYIVPESNTIISNDELANMKGHISFHKENLMIEYLGDIYFYKRKYLGSKVYYEYYGNITFD